MTISWPRSLRWGGLKRSSRDAESKPGAGFAHAPSYTARTRPWNRAPDAHNDASPRAPILASRDLPRLEPEPGRPAVVTRPRSMPRSPQPLSEAQLDEIRAILAGQDEVAAPAVQSPEPEAEEDADILDLSLVGTILTDDMPLSRLVDRFEQQVDCRIAIADSINAAARVRTSTNLPVEEEDISPDDVNAALRLALDRLKALSEPRRPA
ncbi:MAG TPA: hypothetical protein VL918_03960 [Sphingobium sp.]|nr:hypothetical protein [Sphingobium sp.]